MQAKQVGGELPQYNTNNSPSWASSMLEICVSAGGDHHDAEGDQKPSSKAQQACAATARRPHSPAVILCKKVGAEFVGTFLLIFAAEGAAIMNDRTKGGLTYVGVGLAAGLAVTILILSIGHISGAHMNPAATLAFAVIKEFQWFEVPFYIITQLGASIFAAASLKVILNYDGLAGLTIPSSSPLQAFLVECIITFVLMFVATAVSTDSRAFGELTGPAVGATVFLNNLLAGALTGASMNPVRTLGPAIVTNNYKMIWVYIIAPVVGAITGSVTYNLMRIEPRNESHVASQDLNRDDFTTSLK
ncbi:hypothetical protein GOP47_0017714 [Adiantum capillus-veneris]|uniref:Uncharacterized protein n=1 Tax=Adiantum capillus-veneris TaxID=13818 RepID=A0A9D4UH27_ADICA|nr:hypothetical protein GOP47_0017714 [Adiantum capillus-veneris]